MNPDIKRVSTRSRPKAAGLRQRCESACLCGFNTQPPEGGWNYLQLKRYCLHCFNTQPPEGGWLIKRSTKFVSVCFNTQPPEGGWVVFAPDIADWFMFQHAAARRRLAHREEYRRIVFMFQHAAARRRLAIQLEAVAVRYLFQHAAARRRLGDKIHYFINIISFNTQPPEGGWLPSLWLTRHHRRFNTQPPEGGWAEGFKRAKESGKFQHAAARRRLDAARTASLCGLLFQHAAARRRLAPIWVK